MNEIIIARNVDIDLLEKQRVELWGLLDRLKKEDMTTCEQDDALEGVLNMLDALSDSEGVEQAKPSWLQPFTVLLLYPDYLAEQYGAETYLAHVEALTVEEAVGVAQREVSAKTNNDNPPEDFAVLFTCQGHQMDLAAELHS